jgi:hypothetical protein
LTVSDLETLLKEMAPSLDEGRYHMLSVDESQLMALASYLNHIISIYREEEGLSIVFSEDILEEMESISEEEAAGPFALITLEVNSDLMAVGFLAKITGALAKEGISVNAFSAYHHDHLLVPHDSAERAMRALKAISCA